MQREKEEVHGINKLDSIEKYNIISSPNNCIKYLSKRTCRYLSNLMVVFPEFFSNMSSQLGTIYLNNSTRIFIDGLVRII